MAEDLAVDQHEKRRDPRAEISTAVRIRYPKLQRLAHEMCRDMSVGGMFVESASPPPVGTRVEFEIEVPVRQRKTVAGRGTVVWHRIERDPAGRPAGFGVQFAQLDPRFRELISHLVDRFIRQGGSPQELHG